MEGYGIIYGIAWNITKNVYTSTNVDAHFCNLLVYPSKIHSFVCLVSKPCHGWFDSVRLSLFGLHKWGPKDR